MADIFISYARRDRELVEELAGELSGRGATVWWDAELVLGESFRKTILAEIAAAKVAIVIWTPNSVHSEWVTSEATRAHAARKLITLRTADLRPDEVPPPFDILHTDLLGNRTALDAALRRRGIDLRLAPVAVAQEGPLPPVPRWYARRSVIGLAGAVSLAVAGAIWTWSPSQPPPAITWTSLPPGTRFANMTPGVVATYEAPARSSARSLDVKPGEIVPKPGIEDPLWRADVKGEPWLRFYLGDGRFGHVPERDIQLRGPR